MAHTDIEYRQVAVNEDEFIILKTLLDAQDQFTSDSGLAERLGISRHAVWGKLEKLRKHGFEFEAVRNCGYRITQQPNTFHPALFRYAQEKLSLKMHMLYFPVIDSTNNEANRQLSYERNTPFAVFSSHQKKGRGRLGREWYSATPDNLYLSVVFEPNIQPQKLQHFTLWAGIHICHALQSFIPNATLKIKWPNDLYCESRKFAGMLTEAEMDTDCLKTIVFGIGINLNSNPTDYPEKIRKLATSLYAIHRKKLPLNKIAAYVIKAIHDAYEICIQKSNTDDLIDAWEPLDFLYGKFVTAKIGEKEISGMASGIDKSGAILLKGEHGQFQPVRAGDVTLKKSEGKLYRNESKGL